MRKKLTPYQSFDSVPPVFCLKSKCFAKGARYED